MEQIIQIKDLKKSYGEKENLTYALRGIRLEVKKGEMLAIMGPSGSGKSTLLNILGCLDVPTEGEYILDNVDISSLGVKELSIIRNNKIGFVFQNFALLQDYSVYENIELPMLYKNKTSKKKLAKKEIRSKVLELIDAVELNEHKNKYPSQLSGGQQQRVAIARALANNPEVIFADEPTGALDQKTGEEIMRLLQKVNNQGNTVIIITHDKKIANFCNKIIYLVDGNISTEEVIS